MNTDPIPEQFLDDLAHGLRLRGVPALRSELRRWLATEMHNREMSARPQSTRVLEANRPRLADREQRTVSFASQPVLQVVHHSCGLTHELTCRGRCHDSMPRETRMRPRTSSATGYAAPASLAMLFFRFLLGAIPGSRPNHGIPKLVHNWPILGVAVDRPMIVPEGRDALVKPDAHAPANNNRLA